MKTKAARLGLGKVAGKDGVDKSNSSRKEEQIMEYMQSLSMWMAVNSIMEMLRERRVPVQATPSQQEEVKLPVAVPAASSQALPVVR